MSQAFQTQAKKKQAVQLSPQALQALGEETFLKLPLYKAKTPYTVLYVNTELFQQCFEPQTVGNENRCFQYMADVIQDLFSCTLDPDKGTGKTIGEAYIDRQADPLKLSLNGNLGSGRAYYQYHQFNIKGEKTPFAISELDRYSNGVLELEKAIFETIASNSLYLDTAILLAPVLAIMDIHEPCTVEWKSKTCKRAKIIRVDLHDNFGSALTRISHLFQTGQSLTSEQFETLAKQIGEMEGEKFLQRIEHGAWSAGNLSTQAHMIDFDTVSSTRSYAPQFSFTPYFIDNYFGYEYLGQLKILNSMTKDKRLNRDQVRYSHLKKQLLAAKTNWIQTQFIQWMGLSVCPNEFIKKRNQLVKQFIALSSRCYPIPEDLELKYLECLSCSPFHFARFFRFYPILRRSQNWSVMLGLAYILDEIKPIDSELAPVSPIPLSEFLLGDPNAALKQKVFQKLDAHFIHAHNELVALTQACGNFIKQYDALFQGLLPYQPTLENIELTAYCKNEDRLRMHMPFSMAGPLDDLMLEDRMSEQSSAELLPQQIHRAITQTIRSNHRDISHLSKQYQGDPLSNVHVFQNGLFATRHNKQQFQPLLFLSHDFADLSLKDLNHTEYQFCLDGVSYSVQVESHQTSEGQTEWVLLGPWLDHLFLLNLAEENSGIMRFLHNAKAIALQKFQFSFTESASISNFAPLLDPFNINPLM